MLQWGLEHETERIVEAVTKGSEKLLERIICHEKMLTVAEKGGVGAQTDVIGNLYDIHMYMYNHYNIFSQSLYDN